MTDNIAKQKKALNLFRSIHSYPRTFIIIGLCLVITFLSLLSISERGMSPDSVEAVDHSSPLTNNGARPTLNYRDAKIIAIMNNGPDGVFNHE